MEGPHNPRHGMSRIDRLLRVECRPSPVTKAAVQAECRVNGSN